MTQFHEGQEVEVRFRAGPRDDLGGFEITWRKAKIVSFDKHGGGYVQVQFPDGSRAVFDAAHVRAIPPDCD
jgi:hypothetical protein